MNDGTDVGLKCDCGGTVRGFLRTSFDGYYVVLLECDQCKHTVPGAGMTTREAVDQAKRNWKGE